MLIYLQVIDAPEDRAKFEVLYDYYKGLLFYTANQILNNDQDAEDAVQDAFFAIAKNIEKISEIKCPKTKAYLVTIVESKAIDLYRKKQNRPSGELLEEAEGIPVEYDGDDALTRCILNLPAQYREFILLKYHQGYTNKELAKYLGKSEEAVYKLDQRARARLEELCKEAGVL